MTSEGQPVEKPIEDTPESTFENQAISHERQTQFQPQHDDQHLYEGRLDFESLEPPVIYEGEQPEEYLMRVYELLLHDVQLSGNLSNLIKGLNLATRPEYSAFYSKTLKYLTESCKDERYQSSINSKFDAERNKEEFDKIRASLTYSSNYGQIDEDGQTTYEHTKQDRTFFGIAKGIDNIPYSQSLFSVASLTQESLEYIKETIDNKTIALLGGGYSAEDLILRTHSLSKSFSIAPKSIVNIDPYIKSEKVDKNSSNAYISIPVRVDDVETLHNELKEKGLGPFDEMWASFSVPYYLSTPVEIEGMFESITSNLSEGGIARIFPFSISEEDDSLDCYDEVMLQIKNLIDSENYNVYTTHSPTGVTLFIRKLKIATVA